MYQDNNEKNNSDKIELPLVDKNEESMVFPLVINVMVKFWGEEIPITEIRQRESNYTNFKGTIFMEGLEIIERELDMDYLAYRGSISDLKKRLQQGLPVIVILPGIGETIQFATIVCGYDQDERRILTYVPEPDSFGAIPEDKFVHEWSQDDYFSLLVFPKEMKKVFEKDVFPMQKTNKIYLEAERATIQGNSKAAADMLVKSLNEDNDNPNILCMLAGILNEQNDGKCVSLYEKVIQVNPAFYLAYRGLGNYYLKNKNYLLAKEYYLKAIEINPIRFGPIYKNLGIVLSSLGDEKLAKEYLQKYLDFVPNATDRETILQFVNS